MKPRDTDGPEDDELLPRLFRALGPAPSLPDEMRHAWEAVFETELTRRITARRRRRNRTLSGCVGVAALLALAMYALLEPPIESGIAAAEVARVARVVGRVESTNAGATRVLDVGDELSAGSDAAYRPRRFRRSQLSRHRLRLNSNTVVTLLPTHLQLTHGDVYVDSGAGFTVGLL